MSIIISIQITIMFALLFAILFGYQSTIDHSHQVIVENQEVLFNLINQSGGLGK
jgi:hypothetical protein